MYKFYINGISNDYHYNELAREFFKDDEFEVIPIDILKPDALNLSSNSYLINKERKTERDKIKKDFFLLLYQLSGKIPAWGTLTGVKPLILANKFYKTNKNPSHMRDVLKNDYMVSDDKIDILEEILDYREKHLKKTVDDAISVYISIPFCPSKCSYCSFGSIVPKNDNQISEYIEKITLEIKSVKEILKNKNIESIYIGGGTPGVLNVDQINKLFDTITKNINISKNTEITFEAGRPDTITKEKIISLSKYGIKRISINPETMNDNILQSINRNHSSADIERAISLARDYSNMHINSDLILGLPNETSAEFRSSLKKVLKFNVDNITCHSLSIKKGSKLEKENPDLYIENKENAIKMTKNAYEDLTNHKYKPYYVYRQKHQTGLNENIGWTKPDKHSIYNIKIMEDEQTVIGIGAGAIGKICNKENGSIRRIPNINEPQLYMDRFNDILNRKKEYINI